MKNTTSREADERDICNAWGDAYETYLWSYLVKGPSISASFGRRDTVVNPGRSNFAPDATAAPRAWSASAESKAAQGLPWERSLEAPLRRIEDLVARTEADSSVGKFARACAWQAVTNVKDTQRVPAGCVDLVDRLSRAAAQPEILRYVSDIHANLRIPKDAFPTYTLQLSVDVNFDRLSAPLRQNTRIALDRQARLLCLGPVQLDVSNEGKTFEFLFPLRVCQREDGADWESRRKWASDYAIDTSSTSSTFRFDFGLNKSASPVRLLEEDRGYILMRKKAGYVNATEIVIERSLWFAHTAYTMNATLMPIFRMVVESRVLQELSKIVDASDS
jgi:hypothetical protein